MSSESLFILILCIVIFGFVFESFLDILNYRRLSPVQPPEAENIYDEEKYRKQYNYQRTNFWFDLVSDSFSFLLSIGMLVFFGFAFVDSWVREYVQDERLVVLLFFGILYFTFDIINIPFSVYHTFVIESKFGFNKTTVKTFILDKIKGWLLSMAIGIPILLAVFWFYSKTEEMFWIYTLILFAGVMLFFTLFFSNIIVPLFNKQTPLEEGELKTAIKEFADKVGFSLKNIYVIDGSKRSSKANAYFTGLGKKKRIVLYDTLIKDMEINEIVAVLAHEIGHYKKKHTLMGLFTSLFQTALMLYILSFFLGNPVLSQAMGVTVPSFHIALIAFGILYSPVSMILGLVNNIVSRKNEYEADRFAKEKFHGIYLINALKKLTVNNLSTLTPHPFYVFMHYSHPTVLQRIKSLKKEN